VRRTGERGKRKPSRPVRGKREPAAFATFDNGLSGPNLRISPSRILRLFSSHPKCAGPSLLNRNPPKLSGRLACSAGG
jgi:hypothetical protein